MAASKCRQRKKEWTEKLEARKRWLEGLYDDLATEHRSLLQESSQLKGYLLDHAVCHDPNIDAWISNEA